jgi:hypothetical protein
MVATKHNTTVGEAEARRRLARVYRLILEADTNDTAGREALASEARPAADDADSQRIDADGVYHE